MGSIYVICSRQCPNGDGIYTLLYALYKYSTSITNQPTNVRHHSCVYIPTPHFLLFCSAMSRYSSRSGIARRRRQGLRARRQVIAKKSTVPRHRQVTKGRQGNDSSAIDNMDLLSRKVKLPSTMVHRPVPFPELRHLVPRQDLEAEVNNVYELVGSSLWSALTQVRLLDEQLRVSDARVQRARLTRRAGILRSLLLQRAVLSAVRDHYHGQATRRIEFLELLMSRLRRQHQTPGPRAVLVNTGVPSQPVTMTFQWTSTDSMPHKQGSSESHPLFQRDNSALSAVFKFTIFKSTHSKYWDSVPVGYHLWKHTKNENKISSGKAPYTLQTQLLLNLVNHSTSNIHHINDK